MINNMNEMNVNTVATRRRVVALLLLLVVRFQLQRLVRIRCLLCLLNAVLVLRHERRTHNVDRFVCESFSWTLRRRTSVIWKQRYTIMYCWRYVRKIL